VTDIPPDSALLMFFRRRSAFGSMSSAGNASDDLGPEDLAVKRGGY